MFEIFRGCECDLFRVEEEGLVVSYMGIGYFSGGCFTKLSIVWEAVTDAFCPTVGLSVSFTTAATTANIRRQGGQPDAIESSFFEM